MRFIIFPEVISQKVNDNSMTRILTAYYDVAVHDVTHYASGTHLSGYT